MYYPFIFNYCLIFNDFEIIEYCHKDLQNLRKMRVEYDKHKFVFERKKCDNFISLLIDLADYDKYLLNKNEVKKDKLLELKNDNI